MDFLKKTLILACLLLAPLAQARDCGDMRVDQSAQGNQPAGLLADIPVMDQGDTDTCHAYTAAQFVDAYRVQQNDPGFPPLTSPPAVAVEYAKSQNQETIDRGDVKEAIQTIVDNGSCSYDAVSDHFGTYDLDGFMKEIRAYFDTEISGKENRSPLKLACFLEEKNLLNRDINFAALERILRENYFMNFVETTLKEACKGNTAPLKKSPDVKQDLAESQPNSDLRRADLWKKVDAIKTPRSMPLGIYYCQELLDDRAYIGSTPSGRVKDDCTIHAALAIGHRSKGGRCEVLVRNSFGTSCDGYAWDCDGRGQIWVDEESLFRNLLGTVVAK